MVTLLGKVKEGIKFQRAILMTRSLIAGTDGICVMSVKHWFALNRVLIFCIVYFLTLML